MSSLELGMIGNGTINALIDQKARIVWACMPRFDGDPVFCRLLDNDRERGYFGIELKDQISFRQRYRKDTAILETDLLCSDGSGVRIIDFAPRYERDGEIFCPPMLIRSIEPISRTAVIKVVVHPLLDHGAVEPAMEREDCYLRYRDQQSAYRFSGSSKLDEIADEQWFTLDQSTTLAFGPDQGGDDAFNPICQEHLTRTDRYWQAYVRTLQLPLDYQEAVIRSAITLKLCCFEETGGIIAAPTSSLPEMDGHERNWDYRYCWIRDSFFVVRALASLGDIAALEGYLRFLEGIMNISKDGYLQPLFGIGLEHDLTERKIDSLRGYRGNQPVRVGNQAYEHDQHDGYGSVILAAVQGFFDSRLELDQAFFEKLEILGNKAFEYHNVVDAGIWEFRTKARVHTHSSMMCWAACDRLAKIARHLGLLARSEFWQDRADRIRSLIMERAWSERQQSFTVAFDSEELDASLLIMAQIGFIDPMDPRFVKTVDAIGRTLKQGDFVTRYTIADDFGAPANTFLICSFWYAEALGAIGRHDEARGLFEKLLACRNQLGLLAEDVNPANLELWGNFPQAYSHVGLINGARLLSREWTSAL